MNWKLIPALAASLALVAPEILAQGCPPPPNLPVGSCAPRPGTAANFTGDPGAVRVRKSIYRLTGAEITELRLAFQRLRALPSTDQRTWRAQANVHCWYCAGGGPGVPDVHANWAFLPWHRNYLYILEKTLGRLVGNPNFALPYWDWNTPDTATCPGHLRVPPSYLGSTGNSLYDCYRIVTPTSTMNVANVGAARVNSILTTRNTFPLFFGTATTVSALSPGPHGYVHLWVGNSITLTGRQDMGILSTAARDPLFWAHHANIDRLWDVWIARYGTPAYPAAFLNQNWTFWDQDRRLVRLTGRDAANRASRLKYRYAAPCGPTTALPEELAEAAPEEEMIAITPQPQTFRMAAKPPARKFTIGAETGTHVVINLEEVTVPADQSAILRVYLNQPGATAATATEDGGLVEELFIVPTHSPDEGHDVHAHSYNIKIPLPEAMAAAIEAANGEAAVTIVPVAATPEGLLAAPPAAVEVKMKPPYLSVE
jgi:polyphenol oxidase